MDHKIKPRSRKEAGFFICSQLTKEGRTMNSLRRTYLLLMAALIASFPAIIWALPLYAQSPELVVILKNGTRQAFPLSEVSRIEIQGVEASSRMNPVGTWRRGQENSTWTFTMGSDGRFFAQENGFAKVNGPAYFTPSGTFRIDYRSRDGVYTGNTEMRFAPDGRTAVGTWYSYTPSRASSSVNWTRVD